MVQASSLGDQPMSSLDHPLSMHPALVPNVVRFAPKTTIKALKHGIFPAEVIKIASAMIERAKSTDAQKNKGRVFLQFLYPCFEMGGRQEFCPLDGTRGKT